MDTEEKAYTTHVGKERKRLQRDDTRIYPMNKEKIPVIPTPITTEAKISVVNNLNLWWKQKPRTTHSASQ